MPSSGSGHAALGRRIRSRRDINAQPAPAAMTADAPAAHAAQVAQAAQVGFGRAPTDRGARGWPSAGGGAALEVVMDEEDDEEGDWEQEDDEDGSFGYRFTDEHGFVAAQEGVGGLSSSHASSKSSAGRDVEMAEPTPAAHAGASSKPLDHPLPGYVFARPRAEEEAGPSTSSPRVASLVAPEGSQQRGGGSGSSSRRQPSKDELRWMARQSQLTDRRLQMVSEILGQAGAEVRSAPGAWLRVGGQSAAGHEAEPGGRVSRCRSGAEAAADGRWDYRDRRCHRRVASDSSCQATPCQTLAQVP